MNVGSLFSGIGGIDLGLERAGMTVVWQCETDPYAACVLARHWPSVPNLGDVATIDWSAVEPVELLCGGFPCQDVSIAGRGAGLDGEHSGLWAHFAAALGRLRPRHVVVENSATLPVRGLGGVLGDLARCGYDAQWDCIPAAAVGARHLRARTWLVAHAAGVRDEVAASALRPGWPGPRHDPWWDTEPDVGRVADGVPHRVDRLRCLGNAAVPQVAEWIGRAILAEVI